MTDRYLLYGVTCTREGWASSPAAPSVGLTVFEIARVAATVGDATETWGMITCRPLRANG